MKQSDVEQFVLSLDQVEQEENYGYLFFYVGDDHRLAFVTIAQTDNDYESISNLNREGVYRINIGVSKSTFDTLFANSIPDKIDYAALNIFMPHPDYAKQHFICILNPEGDNEARAKQFIMEAHSIASARYQRKSTP